MPMIRFSCPACNSALQSPAQSAGDKIACPKCSQNMLIPNPVKPAEGDANVLSPIRVKHKTATSQPEAVYLEEAQDAEEAQHGERKSRRKSRSLPSYRVGKGCFILELGVVLCVFGCLITFVYWLVYDTTTSYERVHNIGLINNRLVGIIVGVGMILCGLVVSLGSKLLGSFAWLGRFLHEREEEEL